MRFTIGLLVGVVVVAGCGAIKPEPNEPVVGQLAAADPVFLRDDPASYRHCAGDAECPAGALCHPGARRCFSTAPAPRLLEVAEAPGPSSCRLVPVYFPSDSAELVAEARRWLAYDARCVKARGAPFLVLDGYTDARGGHAHNLELSRRRCEAAVEVLRREGVEIPIEMVARAEAAPLVPGSTELALAHNRRVELRAVDAH